ncbi:glycosyltransferase [Commensalibacter oyaizuii]
MIILTGLSFIIWIWLFFFHGRFWSRGPILQPISPTEQFKCKRWPDVYIIVPARDEAKTIEQVTLSLLQQDYLGKYQILVVDDDSQDGTGDIVHRCRQDLSEDQQGKLTVICTPPRPSGWSGKLWALSHGIDYIERQYKPENAYFFFTDADIVHEPSHLATLVDKAETDQLDQVSEMVQLRCQSFFERAFIPAFVYFFCMLYPFSKVNKSSTSIAAGAGGTVLIRQYALAKIGGISALKTALIDDVTLASLVKKSGGKIYLGHSRLARSLRTYERITDVWDMITRTAYVQLRYSLFWLLLTICLMSMMWFFPFIHIFTINGIARKIAMATYFISILSFIPTLSRFGISFLWIFALPAIALFYLTATIGSALNYYRGKGMMWKGRAYVTPAIGVENKELQIDFEDLGASEKINSSVEPVKAKDDRHDL